MSAITKVRAYNALLLLALFASLTFYIHTSIKVLLKVPPSTQKPAYIVKWKENELISCHYVTGEDVLPSAEDASFSPPEGSIFFHVTSCRGGLNSRQACAVEAAAAAHPDREVYVLFSGPVSELLLTRTCLATLNHFSNVHFARVHIDEYAKGTVLEEFIARRTNHRSKFPVEHTSDILSFLTLYKWGGIYLDTDMLVIKSFKDMGKNWAVRQSEDVINVAALAIGKDYLGRHLILRILKEVKRDFKPNLLHYNGRDAWGRVLKKFCNTTNIRKFSDVTCHGLKILEKGIVYPSFYSDYDTFFEKFDPDDFYEFEEAHAVRLWNNNTFSRAFTNGSLMDNLVRENCPMIYYMYQESMAGPQNKYTNTEVPD